MRLLFPQADQEACLCPQHQALGFSLLWLGSLGFTSCWLCRRPRWFSARVVLHRAAGLTRDLSGWSGVACSWVLRVRWVHTAGRQGGLSRGSLPAALRRAGLSCTLSRPPAPRQERPLTATLMTCSGYTNCGTFPRRDIYYTALKKERLKHEKPWGCTLLCE